MMNGQMLIFSPPPLQRYIQPKKIRRVSCMQHLPSPISPPPPRNNSRLTPRNSHPHTRTNSSLRLRPKSPCVRACYV